MVPEPDTLRPTTAVDQWLKEARRGNGEALGELLQACRPYLLLMANQDLDQVMGGRVAPSDVVQDSLLEASQGFLDFRGRTPGELLAWLRRILQNNLANERRRNVATQKRTVEREVPLAEALSAELLRCALSPADSPSAFIQARERDEALERALGQLPDHYRQALLLHTCDGLPFAAIGEQLNCSAEAARKLWARAAAELSQLLGGDAP
jgi:RNA polymerase sigma-70 factor (ECF subfamily)